MFYTYDFATGLQWAFAVGLVETTFPLLYSFVRGKNMKRRFTMHSNTWLRFLAAGLKTVAIFIPLYYGMNILMLLSVLFVAYFGMQMFSDEYIPSV